MLEQEILKARKSIRKEAERLVFDAFLLPLQEMQMAEQVKLNLIRDAKRLSGRIHWLSYDTVRESFMTCACELLKGMGLAAPVLDDYRARMYVRFMEGRIRFFQDLEKREKSVLPAIEPGKMDFHNAEMAVVFAHLKEDPEVVTFLKEMDIRWAYEQLDMVSWFSGQLSAGKDGCSGSGPNHSARVTYNRLTDPYSVVWIAAVLGEDRELIRQAVEASVTGQKRTYKEKAVIIRNFIPFTRIYRLALPLVEAERKWRFRKGEGSYDGFTIDV